MIYLENVRFLVESDITGSMQEIGKVASAIMIEKSAILTKHFKSVKFNGAELTDNRKG